MASQGLGGKAWISVISLNYSNGTVKCRAVMAVQCNTVCYKKGQSCLEYIVLYDAVQCNVMQYCALQSSTLQYIAVQ